MKTIIPLALIVALSGCSRMGATAYADFSESISGTVVYNVDGYGKPPGPQARVGVEADIQVVGGLKVAGGIEHRSFPETNSDRGEERAYVGVRYRWEHK